MAGQEVKVWDQIVVDRRLGTSPFRQIVNAIRHKIATNQLTPGTPLPSVRSLAELVNVTPPTVARAYRQLQADGLIESHVGVGTIVSDTRRLVSIAQARTEEDLDSAADHFVAPLLGLGYSGQEILRSVEKRLNERSQEQSAVFIAAAASVVSKYVTNLGLELGPIGVRVSGVLLSDLDAAQPEAVEALKGANRVLTSLGLLAPVRDAIEKHNVEAPISIVFTELKLSAIEQVGRVAPDSRVLVLTEERHRGSVVGILRSYLPQDALVVPASDSVEEFLHELPDCDVIVYTLGMQDLVTQFADEKHTCILMEYQIREDALRNLKTSLGQAPATLVTHG